MSVPSPVSASGAVPAAATSVVSVPLTPVARQAVNWLTFIGFVLLVTGGICFFVGANSKSGPSYREVSYVNPVLLAAAPPLLIAGVLVGLTAVLIGTLRTR